MPQTDAAPTRPAENLADPAPQSAGAPRPNPQLISGAQLRTLQTLWGQYARHSLAVLENDREERLKWLSSMCGRKICSSKTMTRREAATVIDALQRALGREPNRRRHIYKTARAAEAAGTEGRRGRDRKVLTMAGQEDLDRINDALVRLGWSREQFAAWLQSPTSPLGKRPDPTIRTMADANRVWWALKRMLQRSGRWNP